MPDGRRPLRGHAGGRPPARGAAPARQGRGRALAAAAAAARRPRTGQLEPLPAGAGVSDGARRAARAPRGVDRAARPRLAAGDRPGGRRHPGGRARRPGGPARRTQHGPGRRGADRAARWRPPRHPRRRPRPQGALPPLAGGQPGLGARRRRHPGDDVRPVRDLGLVVVWSDGDGSHSDPRAPHPHVREVALLRAAEEGAGVLLGGLTVTVEGAQLVSTGWARSLAADRATVREVAPGSVPSPTWTRPGTPPRRPPGCPASPGRSPRRRWPRGRC